MRCRTRGALDVTSVLYIRGLFIRLTSATPFHYSIPVRFVRPERHGSASAPASEVIVLRLVQPAGDNLRVYAV